MKKLLLFLLFVPFTCFAQEINKESNDDIYTKVNEWVVQFPILIFSLLLIIVLTYVLIVKRGREENIKKAAAKTKSVKQYKKSIAGFIKNMGHVEQWHQIIQARGDGHAMYAKTMGIKVDDYEYWANAHKDEYMLKYNDGNLDVEGVKLRIEKFGYIVSELKKVIKKAAELKLNITHEMHNDYCAAIASVLGAEYALKEISLNPTTEEPKKYN